MKKFSQYILFLQNQEKKSPEHLFSAIIKKYKRYTPLAKQNISILKKAFIFGKNIHKNQYRDSGVLYFTHPLIVTSLLQEYEVDEKILVASMLHDAIEDSEEKNTEREIKTLFGDEIFSLIDGVSKVGKVSSEKSHQETLQKIFSHSTKDARILVIKIADRIHNISTIGFKIGEEKRRKKISETLEIFVSAAEKLGLEKFKNTLLNACSFYLFPEKFQKIEENVEKKIPQAKELFQKISDEIQKVHPQVSILYRPYQISNFLYRGDIDTYTLKPTDIFYIEVITNTKEECYQSLSWLSKQYSHKTALLIDFIANPPENGYRSLKTSMVVYNSYLVRFHLLSGDMKKSNSKGIFSYFEKGEMKLPFFSLGENEENITSFVGILKNDMLSKKQCVHNPEKGQKYIPLHSTALDAVVYFFPEKFIFLSSVFRNGKKLHFNEKIFENDIIECEFSSEVQASLSWIKYLESSFAKVQLQNFLKNNEKSKKYEIGKTILQSAFDQFKEGEISDILKKNPSIFESFFAQTREELYIFVAEGMVSPHEILLKYEEIKATKKTILRRIQKFFPKIFPQTVENTMRISFSGDDSIAPEKLLHIFIKKAFKNNVLVKETKLFLQKKKVKIITTMCSQKRESLFTLFSSLKSENDISSLSFLPSQSFYFKILGIFLLPILTNLIVFFFLFQYPLQNSLSNIFSLLLIFIVNTFGYFHLSKFFLLLRTNKIFLFFLFLLNIALVGTYFYFYFLKTEIFTSFSLFFIAITAFISIIPSILLFVNSQQKIFIEQKILSSCEWEKKKKEKIFGYAVRIIAILIFGATPILSKYYLSEFSGIQITSVSFFLAVICTLPLFLYRKKHLSLKNYEQQKKYNKFFWIAVLSDMTLVILYFFSINLTSASTAITFLNFSPLLAIIIGILFWKQKESQYMNNKSDLLKILIMFVLGTIGVLLLVLNKEENISESEYAFKLFGDLLAFIAMIFDVIATLALISYTKSKNIFKGIDYIIHKIFIIGLLLSPFAIHTIFTHSISALELGIFLFIAIFNFILAYLLSYEAYKRLDGLINFLFFNLSVAVTITLEVFVFDLSISYLFGLGVFLIIFSSLFSEFINTKCEKKELKIEN